VTGIRSLDDGNRREAAALLACAMRDNPLHIRVFGTDAARRELRLRHFFDVLLGHVLRHGCLLGASTGSTADTGRLVGVLGLIKPGRCRPGPYERLRIGAGILSGMSPATALQVWRWLGAWEKLDPDIPHWHVGPLAVRPGHRRQGIATELMDAGCSLIDTSDPAPAWLETDLERNTRFYRRFGFSLARQQMVLGVPDWFMIRPAGEPTRHGCMLTTSHHSHVRTTGSERGPA